MFVIVMNKILIKFLDYSTNNNYFCKQFKNLINEKL